MTRTSAPRPADPNAPRHVGRLGQWWLNRPVPVKGLMALCIPLLALIGVSACAFVLQLEQSSERRIALGAREVVKASVNVLQAATDVETRVRGYAATADLSFLGDFPKDAKALGDLVGQLERTVTAEEQPAAAVVRQSVGAHVEQLDRIVSAMGADATRQQLQGPLEQNKATMDLLRNQIAAIKDSSAITEEAKRAEITALQSRILWLESVGLLIGLLTGAAGTALFSYGISRRVQDAAANAQRLGAGQPLRPMRAATDEIGRLKASIAAADRLLHSRLEELETARDQALAATRTKNSFLSRTSHELRTPLNAILGFAQLLEMSDLDDEDRESAEHIHLAGRHLLALINELIDISRVESGELQVSMEPTSVARLSQEVVELVGPLAAAREITIHNRITDPAVAVLADCQRLKQVLLNLVSNAIKYNRHAGTITLQHRLDADGFVELRVTDTGHGLSESDCERIWMPFERLDADRGPIEGTGIGLPLARALTEAMHGTVDVESTPGRGSTFFIRLPATADIPPAMEPGPEPAELPAIGTPRAPTALDRRLTVLCIEDNLTNAQVLDRIFRTWSNVSLIMTDNAEEGLALAAARRPDLILMDLHLPGMSGEEAFEQLRDDPATSTIPVVVLSADATPGTVRRLLARGAAAYLTKPLDLSSLHQVLRDVTQHGAEEPAVLTGRPDSS